MNQGLIFPIQKKLIHFLQKFPIFWKIIRSSTKTYGRLLILVTIARFLKKLVV
jgi:hypothetical protein